MVTLTPGSPGRAVVTLRAIDPDGLSAVETFSVLVTAGNTDYDADNDGLIDVGNLAQLDAVRYDLNGDGLVDGATWTLYYDAFPMGAPEMGCPSDDGCTGYELTANLDFDTNGDGRADVAGDTYWNAGAGWEPIGEADDPFTADFEGDGYTIANLFINRDTEDGVGLFGASNRSVMRGVGLTGVDVTGGDRVGGLLGHGVYGVVIYSSATGRVSGTDEVGGLAGLSSGRVLHSYAAVNVSGNDAVGGLVGHQFLNDLDSSYATGNVEGTNAVGGLVGAVSDVYQVILASYATGDVSGQGARLSESDSGFIICDSLSTFTVSGPVETMTSSGGGVGGLVGSSCGVIEASYATGAVSGTAAVGGLVGSGQYVRVRAGYWDLETSGLRVGVGEDDANDNGVIDGTELLRLGIGGKTTAELQTPTGYTGIYAAWNVDLDDPWDFGTTTQYPVLSLDLDDDNRATWQEFGYQVRDSVTLTATTTEDQAQVVLSWNAVSTSPWSPAPDVSYTLYRDDGSTIEAIAENLTGLTHTDTAVTVDDDYTYWVAVVVNGGEAARSAPVLVIAGAGNQPPVAVSVLPDRQLTVGSMAVEVDVAGAFDDPDDDTLTYAANSSDTSVATLSRSDAMLTITPGSGGRTIITVIAVDTGGSSMSATQRFRVTVGHNYDADGNGLIGVSNLVQLDAMRHDLNGNGLVTGDAAAAYAAAFPDAFDRLGCGSDGCLGYELLADLDFDTNGNGRADAGDTYWNAGAGWEPIGLPERYIFGSPIGAFQTTFDGNGHGIANLFVARDDHSGLFGAIGRSGAVRDVRLTNVDVTGKQRVGGLAGENYGLVSRVQSAGQVSGEVQVGGLVGSNQGTIALSRSSAAVTGMAPPDFRSTLELRRGTGGLVGHNGNAIRYSYATGRVVGDRYVGGLVGLNNGDGIGGSSRDGARIAGSYATGSVTGQSSVGGLVGTNSVPSNAPFLVGEIKASYATGRVSGKGSVGGLVGYNNGPPSGIITSSYWDTNTSGHTSGSSGTGRTTAQLQAPTSYSGIYGSWNLDLDGDRRNDNSWHFGTGSQYPVLKANVDGQGAATWQEFGYQVRSGPPLMEPTTKETMTPGQAQVGLSWTAVDVSSWTPAPDVTYTVTRTDGDTVETLAEDLGVLSYTDSTARTGTTLTYQVAAVVDGGEPVRSAVVEVETTGNSPPLPVGTLPDRWLHAGDTAGVEVGEAFQDPEGDTLTYTASSSATGVVTVSVSGSRVTLTPVGAGTATITVTATDTGGSMAGGTQTLTVTVQPSSTTDYDTDDDGLIEIMTLARLDAIRHDLNGDGEPTADGATDYATAFSTVSERQACGGLTGCVGYELDADLDFDTNRNGRADAGDTYWNNGAGWEPFEAASTPGVIVFGADFRAIFEGNGHTIANLFIDRDSDVGLFGRTAFSVIRHVGLIDVMVSGSSDVGGLVGTDQGSIIGCYVTGMVSGTGNNVGGLVGQKYGRSIVTSYAAVEVTGGGRNVGGLIGENNAILTASYATGRVTGEENVGGLVGSNGKTITASYATGTVRGESNVGGLVGRNTRSFSSTGTVTASYWDTTTSRQTTSAGSQGRTTAQLQAPMDYTGIYSQWNDDPWDFGLDDEYPVLAVDFDGDGDPTWEEFGYQVRAGPSDLTATSGLTGVALSWTAVDTMPWNPSPPAVTYTVIRHDGTMVEVIDEALSETTATDTAVPAGMPSYQVAAVVDGGEATRSGPVTVTAPNHPPTFDDGPSTTRRVDENTPSGRTIGLPVAATDPENNRPAYRLDDGLDKDSFTIDERTGQLRTDAALDHETEDTYQVDVSVHDGKAPDHTEDTTTIDDTIRVTITVTDVNEPPEVSGPPSVNNYVENSTGAVATYTAKDPEESLVRWSVSDTTAFAITGGVLTFRSPPDYESQRRYTVTVTATDPGGQSDSVTVRINITNIDEAPVAGDDSFTLYEDTAPSLTVLVNDSDPEGVSLLPVIATHPGNGMAVVEAGTGQITYTPVPDYHGPDAFTYTVSDGTYSATVTVTLTIDPVNDAPTFSPAPESFSVAEDRPVGHVIGLVTATDVDDPSLTYTLGGPDALSFTLDMSTGQLRTNAALNYEDKNRYTITVTAADAATPPATASLEVAITVTDEDEAGSLTLPPQPLVNAAFTATLSDPDQPMTNVTWQWARSQTQGNWIDITEATDATYTPVADDEGYYLQVRVSYTDVRG